jgi:hypothetical protein
VGLSTPRPSPNLEDKASVFVTPGDRVTQLYPQALGIHFSHLLRHARATLGLFLSSGQQTEIYIKLNIEILYKAIVVGSLLLCKIQLVPLNVGTLFSQNTCQPDCKHDYGFV